MERLKSPSTLAQSIRRNLRVLADIFRFGISHSRENRRDRIRSVADWLGPRLLEAEFFPVDGRFVGAAAQLLEHAPIRTHLESLPHFGVLAPLTSYSLSRLDYVTLQAKILLAVKERYKGIGFANRVKSGLGPVQDITVLELTQLWAILSSYGHLFGTFATERALQFQFLRRSSGRDDLLALVSDELRPGIRPTLLSNSMYRFVRALSAIKITHTIQDSRLRELATSAWALYVDDAPDDRVRRAQQIFQVARRLAYLQLHAMHGLAGFPEILSASAVDKLLDHAEISYSEHVDAPTAFQELLAATDRYHYETFFTGAEAATLVLRHLGEFKRWWATPEASSLDDLHKILELASKPPSWPSPSDDHPRYSLQQLARLELPIQEARWINEVVEWLARGRSWTGTSNFLLSIRPDGQRAFVDVFGDGTSIAPEAAYQTTLRLADFCEKSWSTKQKSNAVVWRTCATWGIALFNLALRDGLRLRMRLAPGGDGRLGLTAIAGDRKRLVEHLRMKTIPALTERLRREELTAVLAEMEETLASASEDAKIVVFLGKTEVIDVEDNPVTDIDGLVGVVTRTGCVWHLFECKGGRTDRSNEQVRRLREILRISAAETEVRTKRNGHRVRRFQATWPSEGAGDQAA